MFFGVVKATEFSDPPNILIMETSNLKKYISFKRVIILKI